MLCLNWWEPDHDDRVLMLRFESGKHTTDKKIILALWQSNKGWCWRLAKVTPRWRRSFNSIDPQPIAFDTEVIQQGASRKRSDCIRLAERAAIFHGIRLLTKHRSISLRLFKNK